MAAPQEPDLEAERQAGSDDGSVKKEPVQGGPVTAPIRLLCRNPELAKVILAVGLQMAAADIAPTIDYGPDVVQAMQPGYGPDVVQAMQPASIFLSWFAIAGNVVNYIVGPMFGRLTDTVDKRVVLVIYGFITFLPTFVYWFFKVPDSDSLIWANQIASVFAAIGRSSNVAFALSAQVTSFEDRALAAGVFYGLTNLAVLLLSVLPSFFIIFTPTDYLPWFQKNRYLPGVLLGYQLALVGAFLMAVYSIATPQKRGAEDACQNDPRAAPAPASAEDAGSSKCIRASVVRDFVDMKKVLWTDERIRRLVVAAFCLSLASRMAEGNDGGFFAKNLGYLYEDWKKKHPDGDRSEYDKIFSILFTKMNILRSFGTHIMVLPTIVLTGYCAQRAGTLKVLRILVVLAAVCIASSATLKLIEDLSFVPVVVGLQTLAGLYEAPLMRLASGVARPGRTGMWLSLVGIATEAGSMLGSFVIILVNSSMRAHNMEHRDWVWYYFPAGGFLALLGLIPLLGEPKLAIGWGAAAGGSKQQFEAMMAACTLGKRWRKNIAAKKTGNIAGHACARSQADHEDPRALEALPVQPALPQTGSEACRAVKSSPTEVRRAPPDGLPRLLGATRPQLDRPVSCKF